MPAQRGDFDTSPIDPINPAGNSTLNNRTIEWKQWFCFWLQEYCNLHLACKIPKMLIGPLRAPKFHEKKTLEFLKFLEPDANSPYKSELLPRIFDFSKCVLSQVYWTAWFSGILPQQAILSRFYRVLLSTYLGQRFAVLKISLILHLLKIHLEGKF